jgi:hypothetical protein
MSYFPTYELHISLIVVGCEEECRHNTFIASSKDPQIPHFKITNKWFHIRRSLTNRRFSFGIRQHFSNDITYGIYHQEGGFTSDHQAKQVASPTGLTSE